MSSATRISHVLDLTEEYNLNKEMHREKAWRALEKNEPRLLVVRLEPHPSPICGDYLASHGIQPRGTIC